jgi:hypothetical protein
MAARFGLQNLPNFSYHYHTYRIHPPLRWSRRVVEKLAENGDSIMRTAYRMIALSVTALGLLSAGSADVNAGFLNETIHGQYFFPDTSTLHQDLGNLVVSPTAFFNFNISGVQVTVSDTQIVLNFGGTAFTAAFNGPLLTVVGAGNPITGVTIDAATNVPGFNSSLVSFTSNSVSENIQGLSFPQGGNVTLDVQFQQNAGAAPEPSSLFLAGSGALIGMGYVVRRRRRVTAG